MYDGKKTIAEKIIYDAMEKIKTKSKDEPINIFNEAINNIRPTVEVRSRRVGGATYQVPVEVKSNRSKALVIRWLINASRKRKDKKIKEPAEAEAPVEEVKVEEKKVDVPAEEAEKKTDEKS